MSREAYWLEALECSLDTAGAFEALTKEQREAVGHDLARAAEMESEATGTINIPNPLREENKRLAAALKIEQEKIHCRTCNGTGVNVSHGPCHSSTSRCWKCNGEGRHTR